MTKFKGVTTISISRENCNALKKLGCSGDSMNDVITGILKDLRYRGAPVPGPIKGDETLPERVSEEGDN